MLGLGVGVAEAWALAAWAFAAAASSANSWVGQACGVGPHVQDWFWVGLALARTNTDISSLPYKTP